MNTIAYFEIQSSQPERSMEFYRQVFSWRFVKQEGIPVPYWRIETEGMAGGIMKRPAAVPPRECGTNAFTCSMQVADFDATSSVILKCGGSIALPKFAIPGRCWQGYFLDDDTNVFGIFEVDEKAR